MTLTEIRIVEIIENQVSKAKRIELRFGDEVKLKFTLRIGDSYDEVVRQILDQL